jgi:hypothetical protein
LRRGDTWINPAGPRNNDEIIDLSTTYGIYHKPLGSYTKSINKIFKAMAPGLEAEEMQAHSKEWNHIEARGGESGSQKRRDHGDTSVSNIGGSDTKGKRTGTGKYQKVETN